MSIGKATGKGVAAMRPCGLALTISLCGALAGGLALWSAPALACPNEEVRAGPSAIA